MGLYVNPETSDFETIANSNVYVDKTGLLVFINSVINQSGRFICNSRPRRFGKTYAASMLEYYYSKSFNADKVFSKLEVSNSTSYREHLNKYNVIHLDMQSLAGCAGGYHNLIQYTQSVVIGELQEIFPNVQGNTITECLAKTKEKFIFIIDEWDAPLRECLDIKQDYYDFLRALFKGDLQNKYTALAYLTGILPIKKERGQSAINNFEQYTMTKPGALAKYIGFTEDEVKGLCTKYGVDFTQMKEWYDGYSLNGYSVYNPLSVCKSLDPSSPFESHWTQTSDYESITNLIDLNFVGLKDCIKNMLLGNKVPVEVLKFNNDASAINSVDDLLAYLIHLGYLAYDAANKATYIPNKEIMSELKFAVEDSNTMKDIIEYIDRSDRVLRATLNMDGYTVGEEVGILHSELESIIEYNDEKALSNVIINAYLCARKYYLSPKKELPVGKGYADIVYIPKPEFVSQYPALLVELKWDKTANTALTQIKKRKYPESLKEYTDNILLVGINYNKDTKKHECVIEKYSAKPKDETILINDTICYMDKIDTLANMANITREDVIEQLKSGTLPIGFVSHK